MASKTTDDAERQRLFLLSWLRHDDHDVIDVIHQFSSKCPRCHAAERKRLLSVPTLSAPVVSVPEISVPVFSAPPLTCGGHSRKSLICTRALIITYAAVLLTFSQQVAEASSSSSSFSSVASSSSFSSFSSLSSSSSSSSSSGTSLSQRFPRAPVKRSCDANYTSNTRKNGTLSSPYFPNAYPEGHVCRYMFRGDSRERVQLIFTDIDLPYPGDASAPAVCIDADHVLVQTTTSRGKVVFVGLYCGSKLPPKLMSADNCLLVTFTSVPRVTFNSGTDATGPRGFRANYSFITDFGLKSGEQNQSKACRFSFRSSRLQNGTITSPNYPGLYPSTTECRYLFTGKSDEHISIVFNFLDIEGIPPDCDESTRSDYVELADIELPLAPSSSSSSSSPSGRRSGGGDVRGSPVRLCGANQKGKRTVESRSNQFLVTFSTNEIYESYGFSADYQFKKNTHKVGLVDCLLGDWSVMGMDCPVTPVCRTRRTTGYTYAVRYDNHLDMRGNCRKDDGGGGGAAATYRHREDTIITGNWEP